MPDSVEYWLASGIVGWSSPSTAALCEVVEYDGKTAGRRRRFRHLEKRVGWKKKTTALTRRFPEIYWLAIHRMAGKYSGRKKKTKKRNFSASFQVAEKRQSGILLEKNGEIWNFAPVGASNRNLLSPVLRIEQETKGGGVRLLYQ